MLLSLGVWLVVAAHPALALDEAEVKDSVKDLATLVILGGGPVRVDDGLDAPFQALATGHHVAVLGVAPPADPGALAARLLSLGALTATELTLADPTAANAADLSGYDSFVLQGDDGAALRAAWAGTAVETALRGATTVGGVGAGGALLGGWDYASGAPPLPDVVLADCGDPSTTVDGGFLSLLPGVLVDTAFTQTGGLARLLPISRGAGLVGLGVDEGTAVVITTDGWQVHGAGTVSLVRGATAPCASGPSRVDEASLDVLTEGWAYDPVHDAVSGPGTLRDLPYHRPTADLTLGNGSEGVVSLSHIEALSLYCGTLELWPGSGAFDGLVVPDALDTETLDARLGGGVWAMVAGPASAGVFLPEGDTATALAAGGWTISGGSSGLVLLAEGGTTGAERGWADPDCENPRLARAITGIRAAVVPPDGTVAFAGAGVGGKDTGGDTGDDTGAGPDDTGGGAKDDGTCGCAASTGSDPDVPAGPPFAAVLLLALTGFLRRRGIPVTGGP